MAQTPGSLRLPFRSKVAVAHQLSTPQTSGFLRLPREIRIEFLSYVVRQGDTIPMKEGKITSKGRYWNAELEKLKNPNWKAPKRTLSQIVMTDQQTPSLAVLEGMPRLQTINISTHMLDEGCSGQGVFAMLDQLYGSDSLFHARHVRQRCDPYSGVPKPYCRDAVLNTITHATLARLKKLEIRHEVPEATIIANMLHYVRQMRDGSWNILPFSNDAPSEKSWVNDLWMEARAAEHLNKYQPDDLSSWCTWTLEWFEKQLMNRSADGGVLAYLRQQFLCDDMMECDFSLGPLYHDKIPKGRRNGHPLPLDFVNRNLPPRQPRHFEELFERVDGDLRVREEHSWENEGKWIQRR